MMKRSLYPILLLLIIFLACNKETADQATLAPVTQADVPLPPALPDEAASEAFNTEFTAAEDLSLGDVFSPAYQSTLSYQALVSASVEILRKANGLDSLKYYLGITNNNDPHLIIAAKLINDMYLEGPPEPDVNLRGGGSSILKCLGEALGVPIGQIMNVAGSMTMAEIGTAIGAMGWRWFASTMVKVGIRAASGAGAVLMAATFTWCMIWEDDLAIDPDPVSWNPPATTEPQPDPTYTVAEFYNYINAVTEWFYASHAGGLEPVPVQLLGADLIRAIDDFGQAPGTGPQEVVEYRTKPGFISQLKHYVLNGYTGEPIPDTE
jgi:hypothetical protein